MDVISELKKGRQIKAITCENRPCSRCIFTDYSGCNCPGADLCYLLDKSTNGIFYYFDLD